MVGVFAGQPFNDRFTYRRDVEIERDVTNWMLSDEELYMGFANNQIRLDFGQLLTNVNRIQGRNNIALAQTLASGGLRAGIISPLHRPWRVAVLVPAPWM